MRIDKFLTEKFGSRNKASNAIKSGQVTVNGREVSPSYELKDSDKLQFIKNEREFVSVGGEKLFKALTDFNYSVQGKIFADIGASTGGFTDCLFKFGAQKVYCIDVGEGQLDGSLKDKNTVIIDNFNARNLTKELFSDKIDGVVVDVSFISLTYILPAVAETLDSGKDVIALIKPQFECESKNVGKNGIVKDKSKHRQILKKIYDFSIKCDLNPIQLTTAPICKGKNTEYLILLRKGGGALKSFDELIAFK